MRGRRKCRVVGNPGNAGANMGHPCRVVGPAKGFEGESCGTRGRFEGEGCGIPHLAKNERDVGHPAVAAGIEAKSALVYQARDHFGPVLLPSRRRASMPAFSSINRPKSQIRSDRRLR
jgi:hypothetical protein